MLKIINKNLKRKSPTEVALYCIISAIYMVIALSYIYILVWAIIAGLKSHTEVVMNPFGLPREWRFDNFVAVFKELNVQGKGFGQMLFNSIYFSVVPNLIEMFTCCTFAYCCTKYKFPGSKLPYTIILIMMTLPLYGSAGANYKLYHDLGLLSSYAQVITAAGGMSATFLYFRAFAQSLSWTYAEAAQMDGANDFVIYFKVMFPQMRPIFAAMFLSRWVQAWNNFENAQIYLRDLPTLPVGIYQFSQQMVYAARLDILFAACVIVTIPAIVLYSAFNRVLTTNVSIGGIKG